MSASLPRSERARRRRGRRPPTRRSGAQWSRLWGGLCVVALGAVLAGCGSPALVASGPSYLAQDPLAKDPLAKDRPAATPTRDPVEATPPGQVQGGAQGGAEPREAPQSAPRGAGEAKEPGGAQAAEAAPDVLPRETPDPLEGMNRKIFEANQEFNHAVVYPLAKAYREGLNEEMRDRIDAFTTNLSEPMVFANNVLQLRFDAAMTTLARFLTNSTVGVGGFWDVAITVGEKHQSGDFGETLYVWGLRDSPYFVMPVLGPSNVRDAVGTGISMVVPAGIVATVPTKLATATNYARTADAVSSPMAGLGKVGMLEEVEAEALDPYAVVRSMSDQKRQAELQEALSQSLLSGWPQGAEARVLVGREVDMLPAGLGRQP